MRAQLTKTALTAGIALALTFTLSCSSDKDDDSPAATPGGSPGTGGGGNSSGCPNATFSNGKLTCGGQTYETVVIGSQTWMAENLNYDVPSTDTDVCYDNDPDKCTKYGRLYDWATVMALDTSCNSSTCAGQISAKHRGICPAGWHIPSDAEWQTLVDLAGGSSTAGGKLKAVSGWNDGGNGTNEHGFAALPGGSGYSGGGFDLVGYCGNWWGSSESSANYAYYRSMCYGNESAYRDIRIKIDNLFSVRCLQD